MSYRDELEHAREKTTDLENQVATDSFNLAAAVSTSSVSDSEVAKFQADFGTFFAQQLNTDVMDGEGQQHNVEQIVDVPVLCWIQSRCTLASHSGSVASGSSTVASTKPGRRRGSRRGEELRTEEGGVKKG